MNLKDINKQLKGFDSLLSNLSNFDFVAELIGVSDLSDDDKRKLNKAKVDPVFLSLIENKADSKQIESYIKTIK
tara:strand:- start:531 stop:752 length:222 start_codon:yes stop_codon:yes gene_type:complete